MRFLHSSSLTTLLVSLVLAGCSTTEPSATASAIAAQGGTSFTATVGTAVPTAPAVMVTSSKGGGLAGADVTFTSSGTGTVTGGTVKTDAQGMATVGGWTLGHAAGSYTLSATVGNLQPVTFTATATPGAPAVVSTSSGNAQTAVVGAGVAGALIARVADQYDNPVANVTVTFAVTAGGGSLTTTTAQTNAEGKASVSGWTLGQIAGVNSVTASTGTATSAVFTATSTAGAPTKVVAATGDGLTGDLNVTLPALSARVADVYGNGVAGVTVNFALTSGTATLGSASAVSNAQGLASTTVTLTTVGPAVITATSPSLTPATFGVSTGPTVIGQLNVGTSPIALPFGNAPSGRASASSVRMPGIAASAIPIDAPNPEQMARMMSTRGRLVVTFKPQSFGLPTSVNAYRSSASMRAEAVTAYRSVLDPMEKAGRIIQRQISPVIAASRVDVAPGQDETTVIAELKKDPRVESVAEDVIVYATSLDAAAVPEQVERWMTWRAASPLFAGPGTERYGNDPMLPAQLWHYQMMDAFRAWQVQTGSASVRIGLIDTGAKLDHPQLAGIFSATEGYDFTDGISLAWTNPQPLCSGGTFQTVRGPSSYAALPRTGNDALQLIVVGGSCWGTNPAGSHGTHVSGTMASAGNDGIGGAGMNWAATIIPIRVLGVTGDGWGFDLAQGILYAGGFPATYNGAPLGFTVQMPAVTAMNISIGGGFSNAVQAAVTAASASSVIIVSAGNDHTSTVQYPAGYPEVLAVSALAPNYAKASYSNFGSYVSLSAPGGDGSGTNGVLSSTYNYATNQPNYSYLNGTSMATPHVTGVAALIKSANPSFTAAQIKARLLASTTDLGVAGRDDLYGNGLVNAYRAVTGSTGPAVVNTVRVVNATTGVVAKTATVAAGGTFTFTNLPGGNYLVVAGQDEAGDGLLGVPGRRFMGSTAVQVVTGTTVKTVNLSLGAMGEAEPNDDNATAQPMVVNSWVSGRVGNADLKDVYTVAIPTAGTYTFETSGTLGACGFANDVNTVLRLVNSTGTQLGLNDDTAYPTASYPGTTCSMISMTLTPGQYFIEVSPTAGASGTYRLHIRAGS